MRSSASSTGSNSADRPPDRRGVYAVPADGRREPLGGDLRSRVDPGRALVNRGEVWWVGRPEVARRPHLVLDPRRRDHIPGHRHPVPGDANEPRHRLGGRARPADGMPGTLRPLARQHSRHRQVAFVEPICTLTPERMASVCQRSTTQPAAAEDRLPPKKGDQPHVPQHQAAPQLRPTRDRRRGARCGAPVRAQDQRHDEAVEGERGGRSSAPCARSRTSRATCSTTSSRRRRRATARSRRRGRRPGPRSASAPQRPERRRRSLRRQCGADARTSPRR